jgi:uncharacterized membrane protein
MLDIILFALNILIWNITPFITKMYLTKINFLNMTIARKIFGGLLAALIALINYKQTIKLISHDKAIYYNIIMLSVSSFIASSIYYYLLNKYNANYLSIILSPIGILFTALIGTVFFDEPLTLQMWIGAFIIIVGLFVFINGKK